MFQDRNGLLYISTFAGLSIYDGSRFTHFSTENGLTTNVLNDILEMGNDSLWIVPNSPNLYCLVKGKLQNLTTSDGYYPIINKMIKCSDGLYYALADEGLFRFEKNHFTKINLVDRNKKDAGGSFVSAVEINKKLFIVSDAHVPLVSGPSRLIVYDFINNVSAVSDPLTVYSVLESPQDDILVGTPQGVKKIDESRLSTNQIRFIPLPSIYRSIASVVATCMYMDHLQNIWLCSSEGVAKLDTLGKLKTFSTKNGLPVINNFVSIFEDKENSIWFINDQTGIYKLKNAPFEFYPQIKPGFTATDIYTDKGTDSVWFMDNIHNRLLLLYGSATKEFTLKKDAFSPPYKLITFRENINYLSDLFNVYQFNFSNNKITPPTLLYSDTIKNSNLAFTCELPDGYGNLILSSAKITVLNQRKKILSYPLGYLSDGFVITPDNHLWMVTRAKKIFLFRIHPENPSHYLELIKIYNKELPNMSPRSIAVDKIGNVWIGTRDRGLFCLSFKGDSLLSWKQISSKDGLSDDFISYLHSDEDNNIWACSEEGLDKIQFYNGKLTIENVTRSNNIYRNISKIQTDHRGIQWAIAGQGVIKIEPAEKGRSNFQPKIIFRDVYEGRTRINDWSRIPSFLYNQNNLNFSIAAPSFIDERQIRFSYLLEGSENKSWSDPSPQADINLVNLAPGKYKFRAAATFINGLYPNSETSFSFVIKPPWWQTGWFRMIILAFIVCFSWLIVRSYYRRKFHRQQITIEKQQAVEKERTRIAADMHDDLGAGLSTIRFLSEKVKRNTFSQPIREDIAKMQATSNELIDKMNEIIWSMSEKNDSLENLLLYIRSYSMEYCEDNNLNCSIELTEEIPVLFVSGETRRNIFLSVKESLHNIVKHAFAKNITIIIEVSKELNIWISDDGKGFTELQQNGGGNGLRNMIKRVESIGGKISIQIEKGTTVKLNIPL
jgi:signal transduction histidine kinase/ligand-binding sensor domain-containing protein